MGLNDITAFIQKFQTDKVIESLEKMKLETLIHNPWFLGIVATLALLALILRWRVLLTLILGLAGFTYLLSYTMQRGTELGGVGNSTLLVFVGGGAVVMGLVIYMLFIKSE
ncbi:MAG: hypothetical protein GWN87_27340 [Desulfuromonadales bacterium]|nr:hypothetical protein [Desulfuromonadales bacterium]NIS43436.1 hypothetical protein [Desulfuromonadales bacterium]